MSTNNEKPHLILLMSSNQTIDEVNCEIINIVSDGSGLKPGPGPAWSPGSKARPELDFLGPDPSIGDGSGPRPARAWPGARGHEPGPGPSF